MSNPDCAACALRLAENGTSTLILAHLSEHNNTPVTALRETRAALDAAGLGLLDDAVDDVCAVADLSVAGGCFCDELTGLIGAAALMRPSKSCSDMELKSLKKKFKDKKFAAGCSRDVIAQGAELLGWELDQLLDRTLAAMRAEEAAIEEAAAQG